MVQEYATVRVTDLAVQLKVSESTIRNDLEELDALGQLIRIRGGAMSSAPAPEPSSPSHINQKALENADKKRWIARWAAGMIEDGDVVMFDASSTVLHIAAFLKNRRNLTVFTNGINIAQLLAKEPTNTVIILGGILRPNGNAITGIISEQLLQNYHIQTVFMSCGGFTPERGFFEMDLQEAQMKSLMLQSAEKRIALLDSSKIGRSGLAAFASISDMDYFVTDDGITSNTVENIRSSAMHIVICGEQTTRTYTPHDESQRDMFRVGFANLTEQTPFSRDVRRGLEKAARESQRVELIAADNQLDPQVALQVSEELLTQNLDLVIEYQIDELTGNLIAYKFQNARIPIIAVDIPMVGATYFGVNNYIAGKIAGLELGRAIRERWQGDYDYFVIVEQHRAGSLPAMRIQGQIDGVQEILGTITADKMIRVNCDNTTEGTYESMAKVLHSLPKSARIAAGCFNDDAAVGVLYASQDLGYDQNLMLVGQGADRRMRTELRKSQTPIVGATAFRPEDYGEFLIKLALDILDGKQVSPAVYMEHFFVSPQNVNEYYPQDDNG